MVVKREQWKGIVLKERKFIKWFSFGLACVALLIQACSFFIDKADASPRMLSFFASNYVNASKGLDILQEDGHLESDDIGFYELSEMAEKNFKEKELFKIQGNTELAIHSKIMIIEMPKETIMSAETKTGVDKLVLFYKTGSFGKQSIKYQLFLTRVEGLIEKEKKQSLWSWAFVVFLFGTSLQIFALLVNLRGGYYLAGAPKIRKRKRKFLTRVPY